MTLKINLVAKTILLAANNRTLERFSEESGDNAFTFGTMEYTARNKYIREHYLKRQEKSNIKVIKDNSNTIFKFRIGNVDTTILGKGKSKKFLLELKDKKPDNFNCNLFEYFKNYEVGEYIFSTLKDNENKIIEIYRTDKNIYGKIINHSKIYDISIQSDYIPPEYQDDNIEEEQPKISLK